MASAAPLEQRGAGGLSVLGGKNAALGERVSHLHDAGLRGPAILHGAGAYRRSVEEIRRRLTSSTAG